HPAEPRPRPPAAGAVRDLGRQPGARRPRPVVLLQDAGDAADRAAPRADARALRADAPPCRGDLHPARRARGLALRRLVRPCADGLLGARLLGAGVRARLPAHLAGLAAARLAAGAGIRAHRGRLLALPEAPDP